MHSVRVTSRDGNESRSASEAANTVSMPRRAQVRAMRAAISPRLAMSTRRKSALPCIHGQQDLAVLPQRAIAPADLAHHARDARAHRVHELHDLDDADDAVGFDACAHL